MSRIILCAAAATLVSLWCVSDALRAETVDQAYAKTLEQYYAGRYKEAMEGFSRILSLPLEHEDLHFNLGCTAFRLGQPGRAIYHFERSLKLDPGAEDARYNLETVRAMVAARVKDQLKGATRETFWTRAVNLLSEKTWMLLFLGLWWLALGMFFLLRYVNPGPARAGLVAGCSFAGFLAIVFGAMLAGNVYLSERVVRGIVMSEQMEVREGPDATTKVTFKVHAGLKVRMQGKDGDWVRIRLANGLEGWVPQRLIGVL